MERMVQAAEQVVTEAAAVAVAVEPVASRLAALVGMSAVAGMVKAATLERGCSRQSTERW